MIKYVPEDTSVTFAEIPNEITLCINLSLCPHHCPCCHSEYLQTDIGKELTVEVIDRLLERHHGITCILFMGGDCDKQCLYELARYIKNTGMLVGWYSGEDTLDLQQYKDIFTYIKVGSFKKEFGPLNSKTTNQKLYQIIGNEIKDITYLFWK